MSGVLLGWTGDDGPDVEADARRALTEWAALPDDLNPRDQRQAAHEWKRWCAAAAAWGVNPNPNPDLPRHLAAYALALLDAGYAPSSVQNALAGLDWWCRTQFTVNGVAVRVPGMTRHAGLVLKAWAAEFLVVPGRGEVPVPRAWLVKVAEAMRADGSPIACRDLVMLTWGYSAGLRSGELGVIGVEDLIVDIDRIAWAFVSSKGNQAGARDDDRAAVGRTGDALCPLAARDLLRDAGWDPMLPTAPVIPTVTKQGGLPDPADPTVEGISRQAVHDRLGYWAERAGVPHPELVTPHGLRHSRATHLRLGGASDAEVQGVLRHTSRATTMRYVATLSPWVEPAAAAEVMLGADGDGYADLDLPRKATPRQRGAPVDWGDLAGRLVLADDLARLGPYAPARRRLIDAEVGRWDDWRAERGLTDTEPSAVQVLAWTAWRIDTATNTDHPSKAAGVPPKAETMRGRLRCLEAGLASRGTAAGTVTGPAFDALDGYARRADVKARASRKSAPVFGLDELEELAFVAGCPSEKDTRRWAVGLTALALHPLDIGHPGQGGRGGFLPVPPSAVQAPGPDTRLVTVEGRDPIVVTRGPKPALDAVAALDWLLANTPDDAPTILDPAALKRAKEVFRPEGTESVGKLVAAGPGHVERVGWRLAAPLVRAVRTQAAVAAMTAGALRYDDLAGVRLERVHDVPGGLAAPLLDKGGNVIEGSDVWFEADPSRPALDFPSQFARLTAWLPWGARGPIAASCYGMYLPGAAPPAPLTPQALMRDWVGPAAERAGLAGLSLHSFRRSAATALWWRLRADGVPDTEAVERVQRKLRHADPTVTVNHYIAVIDPGWSAAADLPAHDPTTELCDARQEVHPTVHVDAA